MLFLEFSRLNYTYLTIIVAFWLTVILHKHDSFYCVRIIYCVCNGLKQEALIVCLNTVYF